MKGLDLFGWIAFVLVIIGGINWGLIGLFNINLVAAVLGESLFARLVYGLVGLGAVYLAYLAIIKNKD